ncbi:MAG TPA: alpha-hydroxy acid oxidase [Acidimicrobiales bacterium]|nr:alpha-hydroxy acid oxidase [Acidimicrobiales bacterium]
MDPRRIVSVADARQRAARALPRVVFDFIDGAADDEVTQAENRAAFSEIAFRPRVGADVSTIVASTEVLGTPVSMPLLLAPCGLGNLVHPDGAIGAARAASARGTIYVLSTAAGSTPTEVATASPGPTWFQLYSFGGRAAGGRLIDEAQANGFGALVVTIDTPVVGNRDRDTRHGVGMAGRMDLRQQVNLGLQLLVRPRWTVRLGAEGIRTTRTQFGSGAAPDDGQPVMASPFTWDDVAWIRTKWSGPLVVKGVLVGQDAKRAVDVGCDGIIVSNHGGRQLDGTPASLRALPEVVDAVRGDAEVLLDGGVRRGQDIAKALALGAKAVLVGRPYLYALAAAGQGGVERILDVLHTDFVRTLALLGCPRAVDLGPEWVQPLREPVALVTEETAGRPGTRTAEAG